ncbi:hypothetical protein [Dactylosporangium sp. NPDC048998]|uniref:hypothetical protein n=1 Tax=Dactylosporangium sp. NPDC048998 TaxID=3363976 RepID=UPI003724492E
MSSTEALLAILLILLVLAGVAAATLGRFRPSRRRRGRRLRGVSRTGEVAMYDDAIDPAAASAAAPPFQAPPPMEADATGAPAYATPPGGDVYGTDETDAQQATRQPRAADDPRSQHAAAQLPGIWDTAQAEDFRRRWHKVQNRFVEDPPGSVIEARQLVDEALKALADSVYSREQQLEHGSARASDSIAGMRDTVLQYHSLLDRLLSV